MSRQTYPDGKEFVFTIFDDTDVATLDYIRPIYDFLTSLNLKTTKTVWPLSYYGNCDDQGAHSLEDHDYAEYIRALSSRNFEIALHGARMVSSRREETQRAFDLFYRILGYYPRSYAAHAGNRENLYWGESRFENSLARKLYRLFSTEPSDYYSGHVEGAPYFWGDLAIQHLQYVRSFTYNEINLLAISPQVVYARPQRPWVKRFFISSYANNVNDFNKLLRVENQERLQREGGVCIVSTHLAKGFLQNGKIHPQTEELLTRMGQRNGWFVPVSTVLDFLCSDKGAMVPGALSRKEYFQLETRWFVHSLLRRFKASRYQATEAPYLRNARETKEFRDGQRRSSRKRK